MFTCNACGKKFKTMQAIGGHMSGAHSQSKPENLDSRIDLRPQVGKDRK